MRREDERGERRKDRREKKKRKEGETEKGKMKMKLKIHPNIPRRDKMNAWICAPAIDGVSVFFFL